MGNIRYLKQEEKQKTRDMYERIFPEDSLRFVDYYYDWKIRDNQIAVMESESKGIEVMIHLNPYQMFWNGRNFAVDYIVAVATQPDCRKQGKMQQVMQRVLQDMQKKHYPFTFLLPADPAYYYGQGFVFFPQKQKERRMSLEAAEVLEITKAPAENAEMLAQISNGMLEVQYQMFIQRDSKYYQRLMEEVSCEGGEVLVLHHDVSVIGILAYGRDEEQIEIKELILAKEWMDKSREICNQIFGNSAWADNPMHMMVRITDLQALSGALKSRDSICWKVRVADDMIPVNSGCWEIQKNPQGGSVKSISADEADQVLDIQELTGLLLEDVSVFIREWV